MFGEPRRTQYDLHFTLFGFPVRVHPVFWIIGAFFGFQAARTLAGDDMRTGLLYVAAVIAALFISILTHELGHALVQRSFGYRPWIVLYGFGGLACYQPGHARRQPGTWGQIAISFAGPGAGFLLAGAILIGGYFAGARPFILFTSASHIGFFVGLDGVILSEPFSNFLWFILYISVVWGFVNLLPVYPLDGGNIAREICLAINRREGIRWSLILSIIVAVIIAGRGLMTWAQDGRQGFPFIAAMFGYLAYSSYQTLQAYNSQRWN